MHSRFDGAGAWIDAVSRALSRPGAQRILVAKGIGPATLLAVAGAEASAVCDDGTATLSHEQLARLAGVPRSEVLRARLALIELGLEDLEAASGTPGAVRRMLHHER